MAIYWFFLFLILVFIELVTVNLVSIWFAIGALSAVIVAYFVDVLWIQAVVFVIVSVISLIIMKPFLRKIRSSSVIPTNLDRVIGKTGIVVKKITPDNYGEVKVLGAIWTATSNEILDVGCKVLIKKIDGVKLIVVKEEK